MTKRACSTIAEFNRAWACKTYYDFLMIYIKNFTGHPSEWIEVWKVQFHRFLQQQLDEDILNQVDITKKRLRVRAPVGSVVLAEAIRLSDILAAGRNLFAGQLRDVCARQEKQTIIQGLKQFDPIIVDGQQLIVKCVPRQYYACQCTFKVFSNLNSIGVLDEEVGHVDVVRAQRMTSVAADQRQVELSIIEVFAALEQAGYTQPLIEQQLGEQFKALSIESQQ
ncbi:hypothetical protein MP228_007846 [Amoeboaphelidium protococcarum]|nr:hypothetical protein MP228_007846 [Amoeboaphelidium protococcarum]